MQRNNKVAWKACLLQTTTKFLSLKNYFVGIFWRGSSDDLILKQPLQPVGIITLQQMMLVSNWVVMVKNVECFLHATALAVFPDVISCILSLYFFRCSLGQVWLLSLTKLLFTNDIAHGRTVTSCCNCLFSYYTFEYAYVHYCNLAIIYYLFLNDYAHCVWYIFSVFARFSHCANLVRFPFFLRLIRSLIRIFSSCRILNS